ncbi:MAG: hypothetical protein M1829_002294 [Trizodia sp. TS-e1964]|nr:MAG: hypothetical protein M1829_002294 [Trizodia sp. TS-e1964]
MDSPTPPTTTTPQPWPPSPTPAQIRAAVEPPKKRYPRARVLAAVDRINPLYLPRKLPPWAQICADADPKWRAEVHARLVEGYRLWRKQEKERAWRAKCARNAAVALEMEEGRAGAENGEGEEEGGL